MKKAIGIILVIVLVATIAGGVFYATSFTGKCGDNIKWSYNPFNEVLTVSGEGAMYDFEDDVEAPWDKDIIEEIETVVIKEGVTTVGKRAFENKGVEDVFLPEGFICIGDCAFTYNNLESIHLPTSLQYIGDAAFSGNDFTEFTIPENVTYLGGVALGKCEELLTVTIKGNISALEENLFAVDAKLETVVLPASVKEIKNAAFSNCWGLKTIIFGGTQQQWDQIVIVPNYNQFVLPDVTVVCNG